MKCRTPIKAFKDGIPTLPMRKQLPNKRSRPDPCAGSSGCQGNTVIVQTFNPTERQQYLDGTGYALDIWKGAFARLDTAIARSSISTCDSPLKLA